MLNKENKSDDAGQQQDLQVLTWKKLLLSQCLEIVMVLKMLVIMIQ